MLIACVKGLLAGAINTGARGGVRRDAADGMALVGAMTVGFLAYGLSLTLFVYSLRTLGTARTGAYFSIAPLVGMMISLVIWRRTSSS